MRRKECRVIGTMDPVNRSIIQLYQLQIEG